MNQWLSHRLERLVVGEALFAYEKKHGAHDAVAYYVLSGISKLNQSLNIGMYCSDVQGAINKIDAELLICKLASFNLDSIILTMVSS